MKACDINEHLDGIAGKMDSTGNLNVLHACRPGHPLGRGNDWRWRNLYLVTDLIRVPLSPTQRVWLKAMADAEELACKPHTYVAEEW